jgi:hypothetical protein
LGAATGGEAFSKFGFHDLPGAAGLPTTAEKAK